MYSVWQPTNDLWSLYYIILPWIDLHKNDDCKLHKIPSIYCRRYSVSPKSCKINMWTGLHIHVILHKLIVFFYDLGIPFTHVNNPQMLDNVELCIHHAIADVRLHLLNKGTKNWNSRLPFIQARYGVQNTNNIKYYFNLNEYFIWQYNYHRV